MLESVPKWGVWILLEKRERIIALYGVREALEVMVAYLLAKTISDDNWEWWYRWLVEEIISHDTIWAQEVMHHRIQHGLHHDLFMSDQGMLQ